MMDYNEALSRIHSLSRYGSRPGLDRVRMLLELMGTPQDKLRFIHVAGTNGKGSVCSVLSSVLKHSAYRTGMFTSPYITDFREQIQIDNTPISEEELAEITEYVFSFVDELNARDIIITEFEFVMAAAFEHFARRECDVVVLEAGLGGLLDSTNVIKPPLCAVLTQIGLDHTGILGDTLELIAKNKCGIIKEGARAVSSPQLQSAKEVIENTCGGLSVPLRFSDDTELEVSEASLEGTRFLYKGEEFFLPLAGEHQLQNVRTALCVLEELSLSGFDNISADSIRKGLKLVQHLARFEVLSLDPTVVIDGAHNPDGMSTFAQCVRRYLTEEKGILIMGMLADKDSLTALKYIKGLFDTVYTVPVNNPRAMSSTKMAEVCREFFLNVEPCDSAEVAFDKAYAQARDEQRPLCICGSLYLAGEIRPYALKRIKG